MRRKALWIAVFLLLGLLGSSAAAEARTRFSIGFSFGFGTGHYRPYPHHVFRPYYPYVYRPHNYGPYYGYRPYYRAMVHRSYYPVGVVRYYASHPSRTYRVYRPRRDFRDRNYADYQPRRYYRR